MRAIKQSILTITALLIFVASGSAATIVVSAGGNLQSAINTAQPGDVIIVEAGASFRGPFELPAKPGDAEIVIQSSRVSELPQGRVSPAHSPLMPKIVAPSFDQAIRTKPGAHHYRLEGIEVLPESPTATVYDLVRLGDGRQAQQTPASVPHHIKFDRSYIHGFPTANSQRGISLNSSDSEITRSYIAEIHWIGTDSQAICWWNTPGRNRIVDNYLEAASENILLGGSDPFSAEFIPTGDQILRNYVFKPLTYKGKGLAVKNLLELKNAKGTLISGNIFENNWTDGQSGIAILLTVRNQECTAPYSTIQNITYTFNTVKNAEGGINLLGKDNEAEPTYQDRAGHAKCSDPGESFGSVRGSGFAASHNLFVDIRGPFLTMNGFDNVSLGRFTHLQTANTMTLYGEQSQNFVYRDSVTQENRYGIFGDGGLIGKAALDKWAPGSMVTGNVMAHPPLASADNWYAPMPAGNEFPTSLTISADYRTPYIGKGADIDALNAAQSGSGPSVPTPSPSPSPAVSPTPQPSPSATPVPSPSPTPIPRPAYEVLQLNFANETQLGQRIKECAAQGYGSYVVGTSGKVLYCSRVKQ